MTKALPRETPRINRAVIRGYQFAASSASSLEKYEDAVKFMREAEKLTDPDLDPARWAAIQWELGNFLESAGHYAEAADQYRKLWRPRVAGIGIGKAETLTLRNSIAFSLSARARLSEAKSDFGEVIAARQNCWAQKIPKPF